MTTSRTGVWVAIGCIASAWTTASCRGTASLGGGERDAGERAEDGGSARADATAADSGDTPRVDGGGLVTVDGGGGGVLERVTSVTVDGVTWTFSEAVPVGHFVNGDAYVVGPVTVTAIDPPPTRSAPFMNGSVLNLPARNGKSGFDSRLNDGVDQSGWFDASLRTYPPVSLSPGDALVSSISFETPHTLPEIMRRGNMNISPVASEAVLTVLAAPATPTTFRPSYCDRTQRLFDAASLHRDRLPSLAPPPGDVPSLDMFAEWFRHPWVDLNGFNFDVPGRYMPSYGAEVAAAVGFAALRLTLNDPPEAKVPLTNGLVQYGIDLYGCVRAGYSWPSFGGHRSGRKLPIVIAALLLSDPQLSAVGVDFPDSFGEDGQTVHIADLPGGFTHAWQGATTVYGGHYGTRADGTPNNPGLYGPYEHLQPRDWPILDGTEQLGEAYRRCCTSMVFVGEALAVRLMRAETIWNHPAFFDYADRWMMEDDRDAVTQIRMQSGSDYSADWMAQRQTRNYFAGAAPTPGFVDAMWAAYR